MGFDSVKLVGDDVICLLDDCVVGLGTPLLLRSGEDIVDDEQLPTRWPNWFSRNTMQIVHLRYAK